ncbi:penicillin acylase family protein [soil metagenome]
MLTADQRIIVRDILTGKRAVDERDSASVADIRALIDAYLQEKAYTGPDLVRAKLKSGAEIIRDDRGIPHIHADDPYDLFVAHGYAQAQDRLWQLDFLRRQAHGRLCEVYGREKLESDILSRTLGMTEISGGALAASHAESRDAFQAFADGVNLWIDNLPAGLPVEFEMLDYEPEPWTPVDSVAIMRRWYWYLTGRLPVISTPEAVRAGIGERESAYFQPDGQVAYIVPSGNYDPDPRWPNLPAEGKPPVLWGLMESGGSNNWAAAPAITADGHALLGSDPHVYYTVPADWYDVHMHGAGFDVIGMTYPGVPMVRFGRNREFAWGITNNICLQRDLYIERLDPDDPDRYLDGERWVQLEHRVTEIDIRGEAAHLLDIRFAHDRPIVDHLVPEAALPQNLWEPERGANTVLSLAWVGFEASDEPKALLDLGRARTVAEARQALSIFRCPTWNFVLADSEGLVGYQCTGAIPLRGREYRGYRDANNPIDSWQGYIPFEGMPRVVSPDSGWVTSANNPTAPPDFPYPLYGAWAVEDRAARAQQLLKERKPHTIGTFEAMQNDVYSGRAARGTPPLLKALANAQDAAFDEAASILRTWDHQLTVDSAGAAIFYVFFWRWHQHVVRKQFPENLVPLVQDGGWGLSSALLHQNETGWFDSDAERIDTIRASMREALDWLGERLGADPRSWQWGSIHRLGAVHPAARTELQHELFDMPFKPQPGGASTLSSAFYAQSNSFDTLVGASYRIVSSLGPDSETHSITWPGHSGHPGSPHYADQVERHRNGEYVTIPFAWEDVKNQTRSRTTLVGDSG